jgi:hypothetical protein
MNSFSVIVAQIHCIKPTEKKDDELYFEYEVNYEGEEKSIKDRIPNDRSQIIKIKEGEIIDKSFDLFSGPILAGAVVTIHVREQDTVGRVSKTNLMDDRIGSVKLKVSKGTEPEWTVDQNARVSFGQQPGSVIFEMDGSSSLYKLVFKARLV